MKISRALTAVGPMMLCRLVPRENVLCAIAIVEESFRRWTAREGVHSAANFGKRRVERGNKGGEDGYTV